MKRGEQVAAGLLALGAAVAPVAACAGGIEVAGALFAPNLSVQQTLDHWDSLQGRGEFSINFANLQFTGFQREVAGRALSNLIDFDYQGRHQTQQVDTGIFDLYTFHDPASDSNITIAIEKPTPVANTATPAPSGDWFNRLVESQSSQPAITPSLFDTMREEMTREGAHKVLHTISGSAYVAYFQEQMRPSIGGENQTPVFAMASTRVILLTSDS